MPTTLAASASKEEIIGLIDQWASLLEEEKYDEACAQLPAKRGWSAALIRDVITNFGDEPDCRVTLHNDGTRLDGAGNVETAQQRKEVDWFDDTRGDVWYDLNISNRGSDWTATFGLKRWDGRVHITLQDIHVM